MGTYNREKLLLKAWVRYDGNGELVPGSIVYRKRKPAGKFKELIDPPQDPCCIISTTTAPPSCAESGFWTDELTKISNVESGASAYGSVMQSTQHNCNSFFLTSDDVGTVYPSGTAVNGALIIKYDGDGTHLWAKAGQFFSAGTPQGLPTTVASKMDQDEEGNTYIVYYDLGVLGYSPLGVAKLSPAGTVIWARLYNGAIDPSKNLSVYGIKVHKNGYVYLTGRFNGVGAEYTTYGAATLLKINPTNGDIEASKAYYSTLPAINSGLEQYALSQFDFTPEGDIVLSVGMYIYQDAPNYKDYYPLFVLKADQGLNVIWANYGQNIPARCTDPSCSTGYADFELISVQVDKFGYIYGNAWSQDVIKLNPDGTLNYQFIPTLQYFTTPFDFRYNGYITIVDKEQNILWVLTRATEKSYYTGNPADTIRVVIVTKLDLYGNIQWATAIEPLGGFDDNYIFTGYFQFDNAESKDGILYFNYVPLDYSLNPVGFIYNQVKVPSTQVTGTIGSFQFTDITSSVGKYYPNDLQISFQNIVTEGFTLSDWPVEYTYEVVDIPTTGTLNTITV